MSILVSYLVREPMADPTGFRVWTDGSVEVYRSSRRSRDDKGVIRTQPLSPNWYPLTHLSDEDVTTLQMTLATLDDYPERVGSLTGVVAVWQLGEQALVAQWRPLPPEMRPLFNLSQQVNQMVMATLD